MSRLHLYICGSEIVAAASRREAEEETGEKCRWIGHDLYYRDYEGTQVISIKLRGDVLQALDEHAERLGVSRSQLIRMAIDRLLSELRG